MSDLEKSTFQNRPAYRYIRSSDALPTFEEAAQLADPLAVVKLFNPTGQGSWYIVAYDPQTRVATGAVSLFEFEQGDFSMEELVSFRGRFGLPLERDLHWKPRPLSQCEGS